ncbi:MAG TPA: DOMON-like domain-containing protein [Rhodocyclaceae bacterium]|nr:DOMON-like domain-containing protein [Rhodocyclaceae bacterium]
MSSRKAVLVPYPSAAAAAVRSIAVEVRFTAAGELSLAYRLEGDVDGLRIPEPLPPGPADGLWEHTCFEAFIAAGDESAYREFNFSPSGQWAAYAFADYRQRDESVAVAFAPRITLRRSAGSLELDAVLAPSLLPPGSAGYRLGLTAVIEATDGAKTYWALAHPGPRPDFHLRDAFLLDLAAPDSSL